MRKFILGTDWWDDCDDAVALRVITNHIKKNKIELLGVIINACMEYSASSLDGFLNKDGVTDVPIGLDKNATDFGGNPPYQKRLAQYAKRYLNNDDADDGVRLYRKLLANSNTSVEIMEIGFLQVLSGLLKSQPDDISDKNGMELVKEKVKKIWVMAGRWDIYGKTENNFCRNERSRKAAANLCKNCPVPITFLGFEIGRTVISGKNLDKNDHLYQVMVDRGSEQGRSSWDPMLVLLAIIGDEYSAGYDVVKGFASVDEQTGANYFKEDSNGNHLYVRKKFTDDYYEHQIENVINER